jgi:hypothetical protein
VDALFEAVCETRNCCQFWPCHTSRRHRCFLGSASARNFVDPSIFCTLAADNRCLIIKVVFEQVKGKLKLVAWRLTLPTSFNATSPQWKVSCGKSDKSFPFHFFCAVYNFNRAKSWPTYGYGM